MSDASTPTTGGSTKTKRPDIYPTLGQECGCCGHRQPTVRDTRRCLADYRRREFSDRRPCRRHRRRSRVPGRSSSPLTLGSGVPFALTTAPFGDGVAPGASKGRDSWWRASNSGCLAGATQACVCGWLLRRRLRPVPPGEGLPLVLDRPGLSLVGASAWAAAIPGGRGWRTRHRGVDRSGVILVHPNARPVPPVAVWAAVCGGVADVAAAMESRAVGRRWAWRCAGLVRQAGGLPCIQPRLARWPSSCALTQ